jgi:hypothetical protein
MHPRGFRLLDNSWLGFVCFSLETAERLAQEMAEPAKNTGPFLNSAAVR